ncbi:peptidylprolyl isomerase SurA [Vibrio mangrovi]|uniref:Chaperone SurA n=1 Tax=Vibrio mangrovi TaxID=474394 RepID=A0A1Y6J2C0_9VIBR|nr:peptidylprolyl isomerase SurA [Vibrio mangrovi]MDW6001990.1 peptidylprolyl isomerase SurA [Vibrio mangrovi]SMS02463.1 Chaperone SurA precursor [Vibrio mangrovi]
MKLWKYFLITIISLYSLNMNATPVELDRMAVIVNDSTILTSDIDTEIKLFKANAAHNNQTLPPDSVIRTQVIDKLITDTLQKQEANRIGVKIDDNRLNQTIEDIAKQNDQTVPELRESIEKAGVSYTTFREKIRDEIAISEARNALVRRRINILPAEVESLATILNQETDTSVQYKISHIQLRIDSDSDSDKSKVEALAKSIVRKLANGESFRTLALTYSKGPKALEGGDWGWMRKEEMPTIFADQIKMQSKGTIIGPFRSGVGLHILKIDDVKGLQTVSVTEVNARHILLKTSIILSDAGAKKELKSFIQKIRNKEATFGELAEQYSQDPGSASQQGELGYQSPDIYVPEFKHQVETLPVGQISEPFKTVHGWHIVEVIGRRQVDKTDAAQKNKAYRILFNRKFNEESSTWIQELKASAFIETLKDDSYDN